MKLIFMLGLFCACLTHATTPQSEFPPLTLEDKVLHLIDGKPKMFDGMKFGKTMQFRINLNTRRLGRKTADGLVGFYTFEGKAHSLVSLAALEQELMQSNDRARLAQLHAFLPEVKDDFVQLSDPFLQDARGAKARMVALITEWGHKAKRSDSYLLAWSRSKEGEETHIIYYEINTFKDAEQFFADLVYFLETLMRSCEVAREQFKVILEKLKEQQAQTK